MAIPTMRFARHEELLILTHGKLAPSAPEWTAYASAVAVAQKSADPIRILLVASDGGGPNAKQRAEILEALGKMTVPVYVCSSSAMARGITTAISWLYKQRLYSFNYEDVQGALSAAGIAPERFAGIEEKVLSEQAALGARSFRHQSLRKTG